MNILDLSVVLIIILIIFGVGLSSFENSVNKLDKNVEAEHVEVLLEESLDNLVNNPGSEGWMDFKGTPGLAVENGEGEVISNSVSYLKFLSLGDDYKNFVDKDIFKNRLESSIELVPLKSSISSVKIGSNDDAKNIYSTSRLVKCDFFKKYVMKDFLNDGKCNHNHDQNKYSCNYFKVFKSNLKNSDYYLITSGSEKYTLSYFLDTTRQNKVMSEELIKSDAIYLNDKISFYDDTSAVVFIHLNKNDAKAVLVSLPHGFDKNKLTYDYFTTSECRIILKAWN